MHKLIKHDNIKLTKIREGVMNMANLVYQGKIIRHFSKVTGLQCVTWGGGSLVNISNNITFFYSVKRIE